MPDSSDRSSLTVKQQRDARRAEKVAALAEQQARQRRNRRIGIGAAIVAGVAVVTTIVVVVVMSGMPKNFDVALYSGLSRNHVAGSVSYPVTPPVGGNHNPVWLNCGVYDQQVPNENAVHALEHGAVWITYDPSKVSESDIQTLRGRVPDTYVVISPYPGISTPVIASAWGAQQYMTGVDDPHIDSFITTYWKSPTNTPEPGAPCTGGLDGPGKVA